MGVRRRVYFSGHVQGVGFRFTAQRVAARFEVVGYVKNLRDGRVEVVAEGSKDELDRFIAAIQGHMGDLIRDTQSVESPATGEHATFDIAY